MAIVQLKELINNTPDLPSMPEVAFEVIRVADLSDSTAIHVAQTLAQDPSLSARVLRLSNSSFYGMSRDVASIQDAVILLGMRTIKSLALVAASFPWLQKALNGKGLNPDLLWQHSLVCALISKDLAKKSELVDSELAFCVGLLHDLGQVVLCLWNEGDSEVENLEELIGLAPTFDAAEREKYGYDHAEVGGALASAWNLPEVYCDAIQHHHRPSELSPTRPLADIIHVADILTRRLGLNEGISGVVFDRDEAAFERLGLDEDTLIEISRVAQENLNASSRSMGLNAA
jgi:putative nucleotidyltransferase with HDIG domain